VRKGYSNPDQTFQAEFNELLFISVALKLTPNFVDSLRSWSSNAIHRRSFGKFRGMGRKAVLVGTEEINCMVAQSVDWLPWTFHGEGARFLVAGLPDFWGESSILPYNDGIMPSLGHNFNTFYWGNSKFASSPFPYTSQSHSFLPLFSHHDLRIIPLFHVAMDFGSQSLPDERYVLTTISRPAEIDIWLSNKVDMRITRTITGGFSAVYCIFLCVLYTITNS